MPKANYDETLVVSLASRTGVGSTDPLVGYGSFSEVVAYVHTDSFTAPAGSQATVDFQDSPDGLNWYPVGPLVGLKVIGDTAVPLARPVADRLRVVWTLTNIYEGQPSATFSVYLVAKV